MSSNFYSLFQAVIFHPNKHIRKFSAQAFSFVIRKMDPSVVDLILSALPGHDWRMEGSLKFED